MIQISDSMVSTIPPVETGEEMIQLFTPRQIANRVVVLDPTSKPVASSLEAVAESYGCTVARTEHCERNTAATAGDEIYLGEFDDPDIEIVAFFHELGHVESASAMATSPMHWMNKITQEGLAWEVGLGLARKHGHFWDHDSKQMQYARACLLTYRNNDDNWM